MLLSDDFAWEDKQAELIDSVSVFGRLHVEQCPLVPARVDVVDGAFLPVWSAWPRFLGNPSLEL